MIQHGIIPMADISDCFDPFSGVDCSEEEKNVILIVIV